MHNMCTQECTVMYFAYLQMYIFFLLLFYSVLITLINVGEIHS